MVKSNTCPDAILFALMSLWNRLEIVDTQKRASWLNMAEIARNVLAGQYLNRRIDDIEVAKKEVLAWQESRNNRQVNDNWQFAAKDARIKLLPLYPTLES